MELQIKVNGRLDTKRMALYALQSKAKVLVAEYMPKVDEFFVTQGWTR